MKSDRYLLWQKKLQGRKWYRRFWVFFGIYSIAAVFIVSAFLILVGDWKIVSVALGSFIIGRLVFSPLIFLVYKKQRPYQALNLETTFSYFLSPKQKKYNSFPSDHAVSFAAISFALFWYLPGLGVTMFVLTVLASYSRIILGYHDEVDVVGGWLVGIISALLVIWLFVPLAFTRL